MPKKILYYFLSKHCLCHDTDKICPGKSDDYSDQILDKGSIPNPLIISLQTKSPWYFSACFAKIIRVITLKFFILYSIPTLFCKVTSWCNVLILVVKIREFCPDCTYCVRFMGIVLSFCCHKSNI